MFCFIDGHCDTITKIMEKRESLYKNNCNIDIERLKKFSEPVQFFAIWLDDKKIKTPYDSTISAIKFYKKEINKNKKHITHCNSFNEINKNKQNKKISSILTVEGGETLENDINNLYNLYDMGVRGLTLTWNNKNCIGNGVCGDKNEGLSEFGFEVIKVMNELNMIIDVSHLNEAGFWDVYNNSKKPFIASHSNSYEICKHKRNLNDKQLLAIKEVGGIVGINLHLPFLSEEKNKDCGFEYILRHIDYMISLMGTNNICLGCDFDGTNYLAYDTQGIESLYYINHWVKIYFGEEVAEKIMYKNYMKYLKENL